MENIGFDSDIFRLGSLCKRSHEFGDTKLSLRYHQKTARGQCVECRKLSQLKDRQNNAKAILQRNRQYRAENVEAVAAYQKRYREVNRTKKYEYNKQYVNNHREKVLSARRLYRARNQDKFHRYQQDFHENNTGYKEVFDRKSRANQLGLHSSGYTPTELREHRQKFDNQCALCGCSDAPNMNYVIPKSKGGTNTLSNLMPACLSCCCKRKNRELFDWYSGQSFFCKNRWNRALKILGKKKNNLSQLTLF